MLRFNKYWPMILGAGLCTMLWGGCSTRNVYVIDGDRSETVDAPQDELPRGVSVSDASVFVKPLSRYGTWHHHHRYGQVFAPGGAYLTARWRPYTHGHWEYTEWGWTWVSADPFGWATDHYGRWTYDAHLGWVWVPGRVWGPAWVTWRHGGGYVGWAPLPPGAQLGAHYGVHETAWVFVHSHHLGTHHVHTLIVYDHHHSHYIRLTRRSQQTNQIGNHRLYRGPDPDEVQRRGGHVVHRSIRETEEEHRLLRDPSGHSLSRDDSSRGGGRSSEDTEQRSGSHGLQRDDDRRTGRDDDRRTGRDDHGSSNEREQRADRDRHGPSVTEAGTPGSEAPLRRDGRDSNSEDTDRTARETQDSDRTSTEDHVTDQEQRRDARSGQRVQDTSHPADGRPELEPTSSPERASGSERGSNTSRSDTGASSERETARDGVFENAPPAQNRPSVRDTSTSPGADRETRDDSNADSTDSHRARKPSPDRPGKTYTDAPDQWDVTNPKQNGRARNKASLQSAPPSHPGNVSSPKHGTSASQKSTSSRGKTEARNALGSSPRKTGQESAKKSRVGTRSKTSPQKASSRSTKRNAGSGSHQSRSSMGKTTGQQKDIKESKRKSTRTKARKRKPTTSQNSSKRGGTSTQKHR